MKKIAYLFLLFIGLIGSISGTIYLMIQGEWFPALGVLSLAYMAAPKAIEMFKELID